MILERLFYYVHGLCTMFFIMTSASLWLKENKTGLQRVLMGVMTYWSLLELKDLIFYPSYMVRRAFLPDLLVILDSSAVAAGLLYLLALVAPQRLSWKSTLGLFGPFLFFSLLFVATQGAGWVMTLHFITTAAIAISVGSYLIWAARRYNRYIDDNYSNTEQINIKWLSTAAFFLFICLVMWVVSNAFTSWLMDALFQFSLILLWAPMIYHTVRQREISIPENMPQKSVEIEGAISRQIERSLQQELEEKELWLNPHLTLQELASAVGTNRTYLSNNLNSELKTTFYDYINEYRLRRAMELLSDPAHHETMIEIAERCGFNSLSTFRRVFQRKHGCSVSEWRSKQ